MKQALTAEQGGHEQPWGAYEEDSVPDLDHQVAASDQLSAQDEWDVHLDEGFASHNDPHPLNKTGS